MQDLQELIGKVKAAKTSQEIFDLVDQFRPGNWTDEERALMSRTYIAALALLGDIQPVFAGQNGKAVNAETAGMEETAASEQDEVLDQEEVWYEKM